MQCRFRIGINPLHQYLMFLHYWSEPFEQSWYVIECLFNCLYTWRPLMHDCVLFRHLYSCVCIIGGSLWLVYIVVLRQYLHLFGWISTSCPSHTTHKLIFFGLLLLYHLLMVSQELFKSHRGFEYTGIHDFYTHLDSFLLVGRLRSALVKLLQDLFVFDLDFCYLLCIH